LAASLESSGARDRVLRGEIGQLRSEFHRDLGAQEPLPPKDVEPLDQIEISDVD
jgi:hypothetical protein